MTEKMDWTNFYVRQAHRAAMDLRWLDRQLGYRVLEDLRETKRWIDEALEKAEAFEKEAEDAA